MKNSDFHIIIVARADHRVISADAQANNYLNHDLFSRLEDHVAEDERDYVHDQLENGGSDWFPVMLLSQTGTGSGTREPFFLRIIDRSDPDYIRILMVRVRDIIHSHAAVTRELESMEAIASLYDDVFFEYDPRQDTMTLMNADNTALGNGTWKLGELLERMSAKMDDADRQNLREVRDDLRMGTGHFRVTLDADLLESGTDTIGTMITGNGITHYDGRNTTCGVIHGMSMRQGEDSDHIDSVQRDSLTGLVGRADIIRMARERISLHPQEKTTLAIVDIDFFKNVNDTFGHKKGDEVIRTVSGIIDAAVGGAGVVGRFGGDEFLIVFSNLEDEAAQRSYLRNMKMSVRNAYPDLWNGSPLTISIGSATYPQDAQNYDDLFLLADYCLYLAKDKGRNRYILYTKDKHESLETVRTRNMAGGRISDRGETSPAEVLINMIYLSHYGRKPSIEELLQTYAQILDMDNIGLFAGNPLKVCARAGRLELKEDKGTREQMEDLVNQNLSKLMGEKDFVYVNRLESLPAELDSARQFLEQHGILSLIGVRFRDRAGTPAFMLMTSIGRTVQWNQLQFKYHRLFADVLSEYDLAQYVID